MFQQFSKLSTTTKIHKKNMKQQKKCMKRKYSELFSAAIICMS